MNRIDYFSSPVGIEDVISVSGDAYSPFQSADVLSGADAVNYATFENIGIDMLDGTLVFAEASDNLGYISAQQSDSAGEIYTVVRFVFSEARSIDGVTINFHQDACEKFTVGFVANNTTEQASITGNTPKTVYVANRQKSPVDAVWVHFTKTSKANQFVKISSVEFGKQYSTSAFFGGINIYEEISPDCSDTPASTCDFEAEIIDSYVPPEGQKIYVYHDAEFYGKYYIDKVNCIAPHRFQIESSDELYQLDNSTFAAVSQQSGITPAGILASIKTRSGLTVESDNTTALLTGFIKEGNSCRYALTMLAFALGFYATGARRKSLKLVAPSTTVTSNITSDRIIGYATYERNTPYTKKLLYQFSGDFGDDYVINTYSQQNPEKAGIIVANGKEYGQYSLFNNAQNRFNEIIGYGWSTSEVHARIIVDHERVGDIVTIATELDGVKRGVIRSMNMDIRNKVIADIVIAER